MSSEREMLIRKYNVPGPRYTSYPTVPYWDTDSFSPDIWGKTISQLETDKGISLYIHLPYCESLCTFCGCTTRITVNHAVEVPYIEAVLAEWKLYSSVMSHKPLIKELHLGGGTPTFFSPANLEKLITGIFKEALIDPEAELGFEGHPASTNREHLQVLYNLGFRRVSFGIQDFDSKVQAAINRHQTFDQVQQVTKAAREVGYTSINYDLVYGLPFQTISNIEETVQKIGTLKPDRIAFYSYAHVPWIKPGQRSFTEKDLPDDEAKRVLYETGRCLLEQSGYYEIGMDHFALKSDPLYTAAENKTLHRNFMGYTTRHTDALIGLGVSSISDAGGVYVQNRKIVEEYIKGVYEGYIPVLRGHVLSREDRILRWHILNIMCRLQTTWERPSAQCSALLSGIGNMKEMEADGLIKVGLYSLEVTEKGRPFLRNICMALDARMQANHTSIIQFSKTI